MKLLHESLWAKLVDIWLQSLFKYSVLDISIIPLLTIQNVLILIGRHFKQTNLAAQAKRLLHHQQTENLQEWTNIVTIWPKSVQNWNLESEMSF